MIVRLERFGFHPRQGTFGKLRAGSVSLLTLERPWKGNQPRVSCVPAGEYRLEAHSSRRFPGTWALVGETVSHFPEDGKARSAILFHAANRAEELAGCIAPGEHIGLLTGDLGVLRSRDAMARLQGALKVEVEPHRLVITETRGVPRSMEV